MYVQCCIVLMNSSIFQVLHVYADHFDGPNDFLSHTIALHFQAESQDFSVSLTLIIYKLTYDTITLLL